MGNFLPGMGCTFRQCSKKWHWPDDIDYHDPDLYDKAEALLQERGWYAEFAYWDGHLACPDHVADLEEWLDDHLGRVQEDSPSAADTDSSDADRSSKRGARVRILKEKK